MDIGSVVVVPYKEAGPFMMRLKNESGKISGDDAYKIILYHMPYLLDKDAFGSVYDFEFNRLLEMFRSGAKSNL